MCDEQVDIIISKGDWCVFWDSGWGRVCLINKQEFFLKPGPDMSGLVTAGWGHLRARWLHGRTGAVTCSVYEHIGDTVAL